MAKAEDIRYTKDLEEIPFKRNDTFEQPIGPCYDSENTLWNFGNTFVSARAKAKDNQGTTILEFSTDDDTMVINETVGYFTIKKAKVNTDITPGSYKIDFEFRTSDNKDKTLYEGVIVVEDDITK